MSATNYTKNRNRQKASADIERLLYYFDCIIASVAERQKITAVRLPEKLFSKFEK